MAKKTCSLPTNKITIKQIGGNDGYCWCLLVNGRVKYNGMTRNEAEWRQDLEISRIKLAEILSHQHIVEDGR